MDPFLIAYKRKTHRILTTLSGCMMSSPEYTSSDKGFFETDKHCKLFEMGYDTLPEFPDGLNNTIVLMYKIIGHKSREVYFHRWTIMSVDETLQRYKKYCREGQKDVFDIAYRYMGMGHIEVLSCDLSTHRLYTRADGGSNGYDREINHELMIKKGPIKEAQIFFKDWFYQ